MPETIYPIQRQTVFLLDEKCIPYIILKHYQEKGYLIPKTIERLLEKTNSIT